MPFKKGETPQGAKVFKPGQSGNPNGRPAGAKSRSTIARKVLEMVSILPDDIFKELKAKYPSIEKKMTVEEISTIVIANNAAKGDTNSYKALMDSAYGAPKQEVDSVINGQININIESNDADLGDEIPENI